MANFALPVELYMSRTPHTIGSETKLAEADRKMADLSVSALPVIDRAERPLGILSRSDLIAIGRLQAGAGRDAMLLTLPDKEVGELIEREPLSVTPMSPLDEAARTMVRQRVHRLLVLEDERLIGVLSTTDMMLAVRDKRVNTPLSEYMSSPLFTIRTEEPISLAAERLERAHVSGLVVLEGPWPVGVFTQLEALASRDLPRTTPVEEAMSPAVLRLNPETRIHRAAAQAAAMDVRRIVVAKSDELQGIVSGLDFVRVVAS